MAKANIPVDKKETREAHKKAFLALMMRGEVISQKKYGTIFKCMRVGARIWELRKEGHPIITTMIYNEKTGEKYAEYSYEGVTPEPVKKRERVMKGKTVADFSRAINQVKPSKTTEVNLFQ
jgi:hypothetical protein